MTTIRDRILNSKPYLDGKEFTVARAQSQVKLDTDNRTGVANALNGLVHEGKLTMQLRQVGSRRTSFYTKAHSNKAIMSRAWVTTPSPQTPAYC